jgi:hypothetical protein
MARFETHDFYCLQCANKTIPVVRKLAKKREKFHRKKLWCPTCRLETNCIEITNYEEKEIFMEAYANGEYRNEATESLNYLRAERIGQVNMAY